MDSVLEDNTRKVPSCQNAAETVNAKKDMATELPYLATKTNKPIANIRKKHMMFGSA